MKVGSLFSGIGGFDLAFENCGHQIIWQSEIHPYASKVLAKHWPGIPNLGDIREIDWSKVERPDIICGGYPCQPFSYAGTRTGETDPRHLWPEARDCISQLRPRFAFLENVPGHRTLGLQRVLGDLTEIGYDAEWGIVSAASVGACHLRKRLWIIAYLADTQGVGGERPITERDTSGEPETAVRNRSCVVPDPDCRLERYLPVNAETCRAPALGDNHWTFEPDVGRVADGVPSRVDRLRCLGNAIVPAQAEYVIRRFFDARR